MEWITYCLLTEKINYQKMKQIVATANQYQSYIIFKSQHKEINAKSLLSLSILNGTQGEISIQAKGKDAYVALQAITQHMSA